MGIESCAPGETIMGEPMQIIQLGRSEIPYALFLEYIFELGEGAFKVSYHLGVIVVIIMTGFKLHSLISTFRVLNMICSSTIVTHSVKRLPSS